MANVETISVTDFKAKCLELFDRLNGQGLDAVQVTKRGRVVAVVKAPPPQEESIASLHGSQRGSVIVPEGFDWTAPVLEDDWIDTAEG